VSGFGGIDRLIPDLKLLVAWVVAACAVVAALFLTQGV
jgi:hypothetical protein